MEDAAAGARSLLDDGVWRDGRPKLHLTRRALTLRHERPDLFEKGEYLPLDVSGPRAEHLVAFARRHEDLIAITVAPRLYTRLTNVSGALLPGPDVWADTRIDVSGLPATVYRNVLTDKSVRVVEGEGGAFLRAEDLLKNFSVALLAGVQEQF